MTSKQAARTVSEEWIGTDEVDRILAETSFLTAEAIIKKKVIEKKS